MGWGSIVSYGLVLVAAPLLAAVLTLSAGALRWLRDSPTSTGPTPMAALVATTVASQLVANAGLSRSRYSQGLRNERGPARS